MVKWDVGQGDDAPFVPKEKRRTQQFHVLLWGLCYDKMWFTSGPWGKKKTTTCLGKGKVGGYS